MESIKIILTAIIAAVVYGIVHDEITARVCLEYFTIGHPNVFGADSPTLLGLGWGIIATWWAGALIGLPLSIAARRGPHFKRTASSLIVPMMRLLSVMSVCAILAGLVGFLLATTGHIELTSRLGRLVPTEAHRYFLADLFAHNASYVSGFVGGIILAVRIYRNRVASSGESQRE